MRVVSLFLALLFVAGGGPTDAQEPPPTLFQYSTINALLHGLYDGDMTFGELAQHGDFGLGTLDHLDGEMIAVDGAFYQVRADGRAYPISPEAETPFAVVTRFVPEHGADLVGGQDLEQLTAYLDRLISRANHLTAVRIDGRFRDLTVRSVPTQSPPYRALAEVIADQVVYDLEDVAGTLVGLRTPDYMAGLNVPGYHFHFLSDDRRRGGHVLALTTGSGTIALDEIEAFTVRLPTDASFAAADLTGARGEELEKVEQSRD